MDENNQNAACAKSTLEMQGVICLSNRLGSFLMVAVMYGRGLTSTVGHFGN